MLLAVLASLALAVGDDVAALKQAAKEATAAERWCDAHGYFQTLFARTNELKHLYNAAEVARAAKDNVGALAAYRDVARRAPPDFAERERVARVIAELEGALASGDLGTACAAPPALPPSTSIATTVHATPKATPPPVVVEERAPPALVVIGGVLAGTGAVAAVGFGVWAFALENQLQTRAPDVTREQKDSALAAGWPIVIGASTGVVAAGIGAALVVLGRE